jgi:hypothetical protein
VGERSRIAARGSVARRTEVAGPRASRRLVHGSKERAPGGAERDKGRLFVPRSHVALRALVWPGMLLRCATRRPRTPCGGGRCSSSTAVATCRRWVSDQERRSARRARMRKRTMFRGAVTMATSFIRPLQVGHSRTSSAKVRRRARWGCRDGSGSPRWTHAAHVDRWQQRSIGAHGRDTRAHPASRRGA